MENNFSPVLLRHLKISPGRFEYSRQASGAQRLREPTGVDGAELFSPQDWSGMENTIVRWLAADCPRPTSAADTMRERYHPRIIVERHLEIYREVPAINRPQS